MKNSKIASMFYEMADLLEIKGVKWKPRAYREAARTIETMRDDIGRVYEEGGIEALEDIPGVGEGLAERIEEFLKTGEMEDYRKLKKEMPPHLHLLVKIPGMGPRKVKKLNKELDVSTVRQLEKAAKEHRIREIEGFGEKSEEDILESIKLMRKSGGRIKYSRARKIADRIIRKLRRMKGVKEASAAGSLRRKRETIGDIDILASSDAPEQVIDRFTSMKGVQRVVGKGGTKATVYLKSGVQVDLRVLPPESWGAGMLYFTGSKNFNIRMRKKAAKEGYKLSEYGLFDKKSGKQVAGKTEKGIFKKIGEDYVKPEKRRN